MSKYHNIARKQTIVTHRNEIRFGTKTFYATYKSCSKANRRASLFQICDFTRIYPVIEGETFYNEEDVIAWLHEEVKNV